ncbi:DNA-binding response regulator [Tenuifilaceae bacterium CYCD]|nr:DNA-binding response regulator [Tenuifilaceae bacterium CYCD]
MIRTVIVDDEEDCRVALHNLLNDHSAELEVAGLACSVVDGVKLIHRVSPDLVFLDIQMQDGTGFDLLEIFTNPRFSIVFVTSYDNYALKAFQYAAMDYLLKPVDPELLAKTIEKYKRNNPAQSQQLNVLMENHKQGLKKMAIPTTEGVLLFDINTITHLEGDGCYTNIFTLAGDKKMVSKNLKEFEIMLDTSIFFRSHKSHIVNLNHVNRYVQSDGGYLILNEGTSVPVARRKKDELEQLLGL